MQPSDLSRLVTVADPQLAPDGRTIAFVIERVDMDAGCYRSAIWLAATDGATPPSQLTAGAERDSAPVWSPDGRRLAYTRSLAAPDEGQHPQHWLLVAPVTGPGEVVAVATSDDEAFDDLAWSPDGRWLAYTRRVRDARYKPAHDRLRPPRRIATLWSRLDSVGWIIDRRSQVFVVAADATGAPRQLTEGPYDHGAPSWAPSSDRLVSAAARHERWDVDLAIDLWVLDVAGEAAPRRLTGTDRVWESPAWSPDGSRIAALVTDWLALPRHSQVATVDVATGSATVLTGDLDRHCAPMPGRHRPAWVGDRALLFSAEDRGAVPVLRVPADGPTPGRGPEVVVGDRWVTGFDVTEDGSAIAFCATTADRPLELFAGVDGEQRQLTNAQDGFLAACPPLPQEHFTVPSPAGDGDIDAWMVRPPGLAAGDTRRHPMLLQIHGGPATQYGDRWFDEVQLYASAGYVVVFANPHGSSGSSEAWARAIRSPLAKEDPGTGWGGTDHDDLMAVVDAALGREPAVDPDRLGVLGGSYGGFMTSWAVGHSDRFAAGCSERAVNNLLTEEWTSDLAGSFRWELGIDPVDHAAEYLRMSPITYAREIRTPLLILHSEEDQRCPVEQADQLYVMLRLLGREVEYWRFPAESHELSRSGSPVHRRQRAEIILDWFARWLRP